MSKFFFELQSRGLIKDVSDESALKSAFENSSNNTFYCGFDPTASSLHVGSLLPLSIIRRLQSKGLTPIALIGSATAMIGDPSGKSEERSLLSQDQIQHNIDGIENQLTSLLGDDCKILKNADWLSSLNYIEFLRDIGKHFSVNSMISKDSVNARLNNREQGISYTEFSYMLMQAYDFYQLNKNHNCQMQIGGSDQWGNITEGIDLIRRLKKETDAESKALGFTFPLLLNQNGEKFGKTQKGAVWLDPSSTSPYEFYQYWLNTSDDDSERLLKIFSEKEIPEIDEVISAHKEAPEKRLCQKTLASELTTLIHGEEEVKNAEVAAKVFFGSSLSELKLEDLKKVLKDVPSSSISKSELNELDTASLLTHCKIEPSKSSARRLIQSGGVYLNNNRVEEANYILQDSDIIENKLVVIRCGKKKYHLLEVS